jgi:hypothetical protein
VILVTRELFSSRNSLLPFHPVPERILFHLPFDLFQLPFAMTPEGVFLALADRTQLHPARPDPALLSTVVQRTAALVATAGAAHG